MFANSERMITKKVSLLFETINSNHVLYGNYYLDSRHKLNQDSIIYSCGLLNDVSFDLDVSNKHQCQVFMFDPTPLTREFMKKHQNNSLLRYFPIGVWTENVTLNFFQPTMGGSASIFENNTTNTTTFPAICKSVETIMHENKHDHIDVLKMDIEGAALPILEQLFDKKIYPKQIVAEFERPEKDVKAMITYFHKIISITEQAKAGGYEVYFLPRDKSKYFSLELLFVKFTSADEKIN